MTSAEEVKKSSLSFWATGIRNGLNARVGAKLAVTIPTGEYASRRIELWAETDLPSEIAIPEGIRDVYSAVEEELTGFETKIRHSTSSSSATSQPPSSSPIHSTPTPEKAEHSKPTSTMPTQPSPVQPTVNVPVLPWRTNAKGLDWLFSDTPGLEELVAQLKAQPKKTLIASGFRYGLSGDGDRFVNRWVHREGGKQ